MDSAIVSMAEFFFQAIEKAFDTIDVATGRFRYKCRETVILLQRTATVSCAAI